MNHTVPRFKDIPKVPLRPATPYAAFSVEYVRKNPPEKDFLAISKAVSAAWNQMSASEKEQRNRAFREALDAHILQDIRDSLPQPPKIHYMHGEGRGRKPDLVPK